MSILLVQWAELVLPKVLSTDQVPLLSPPVLPARPARLTEASRSLNLLNLLVPA